jgi:hypothetical protein
MGEKSLGRNRGRKNLPLQLVSVANRDGRRL